jgi:preprotein translocase subunit SecE
MARTSDAKVAPRPTARALRLPAVRGAPAVVERISRYLREVWMELGRVEWPSRRELVSMTLVVLVVLLITAVYLGIFDYVYTWLIKRYLVQPRV